MSNVTALPLQKLPMSKKNKEWKESNVKYYVAKYKSDQSKYDEIKICEDLYNSIYDEKDIQYVTNPFRVKEGFPAAPHNFNIIKPKIDLLVGEMSKRPDSFKVYHTSEDAVSKIQEKKVQSLKDYISAYIMQGGFEEEEEEKRLAEIEEYFKGSYVDEAEEAAYHSLNYLKEKLNLDHLLLKGFKDGLITNKEIYYCGIVNGDPYVEKINPYYLSHDENPELENIEDGEWAVNRVPMTISDIHDRLGDLMTDAQFDQLIRRYQSPITSSKSSDVNYTSVFNRTPTWLNKDYKLEENMVDVYHVVWRSLKRVGFLNIPDPETGVVNTVTVDENYESLPTDDIEWEWITEIWEGYYVEDDLYVGIQPIENQEFSIDSPNVNKLPYIGSIYNGNNSKGKSLVSIMKPLQYMYIIVWYRLELMIARDKGKVLTMDITQIPKSMGIDVPEFMHYLSSMGVAFINPYECFDPNTKVLMGDASIKKIKDIKIGDFVIGPDGKPRKVLNTHSGIDHMYRLKLRSGGKDQVVNSRHKIFYKQKYYHNDTEITKISTPIDLLKEDNIIPYIQNTRYLERANDIDISWNSDVLLDPYILGLWLGDGSTNKPEFTTADPEIISFLIKYANENGLRYSINPTKSSALSIRLSNIENIKVSDNKPNSFVESLRYYGIYNNKNIPNDYIYTSRENRLKLLAGLIDTDGYYNIKDRYYIFSQCESRKHIVEIATFIARSLGFKCTVKKYIGKDKKYICNSKNISTCEPIYVLSILDGNKNIPTLIKRKQGFFGNKKGKTNQSNFKVEYEGVGEFCGITIDGDSLFLLDDFTIVHNSEMIDIPGRDGGHPSSFNTFSAQDLTMGNSLAEYINLLAKLEEMIGELSGVSRQRLGQVENRETKGGIERAVTNSSHVTEMLFYTHNSIKKRLYNYLLNCAKIAWSRSNKKKLYYIMDDSNRAFIDLNDEFLYSDLGVFVTDSTKENNNIELLRQLLQPAMQSGATLLDASYILTASNMTMIKNRLKDIEARRQDAERRQAEGEQAAAQQGLELQMEQLRLNEEDSIRKAETSIQVALIQAQNKQGSETTSDEPSDLDYQKLQLDKDKLQKDYEIKKSKLEEDRRKNRTTEELKDKQLKIQSSRTNKTSK